jgi:8-oxo-dGTP pyrophosphatase MutT (NUDIX family)
VAGPMRVETLDLSLGDYDWAFARERRADIDNHFDRLRQEKPSMWNGRVLLMDRFEVADNTLRGGCFETDFASFVAWRDFGFPDLSVKNVFALGALQGSDGGYVLGVMGAHTMNAGKIYFPGGTPDLNDVRGDRVDLESSVRREVQEETGLAPAEFEIDAGWHCILTGPMIALLKPMRARETAARLRERILDHIDHEADPELAGAVVVNGPADIRDAMPGFVQTFLRGAPFE